MPPWAGGWGFLSGLSCFVSWPMQLNINGVPSIYLQYIVGFFSGFGDRGLYYIHAVWVTQEGKMRSQIW